jgi:hypothetical protein
MNFQQLIAELDAHRRDRHERSLRNLEAGESIDQSKLTPEQRELYQQELNAAMQSKVLSSDEFHAALVELFGQNVDRIRNCKTAQEAMDELSGEIRELVKSFGWESPNTPEK